MKVSEDYAQAEFEAFVRAHWSSLMAIARAVSGTRADAEDLLQTALTAVYPRWQRVRQDQALAYVRRAILNASISRWRRHRGAEVMHAEPPELACAPGTDAVDDQQSLLPILRTLPARQRAVLVLRYLCDLPDDEIACTLGIAPSTVRSQALRGLATLRSAHATDRSTTSDSTTEVTT